MDATILPVIPHPVTPYPKLIINAAITGMVPRRQDSPHVPLTVDEIIEDAEACWRAGASIVHLHARDETGRPTPSGEIYGEIIAGVRERCPDVLVCASTSGRLHNTFEARSEVLELEGRLKPDMASLTVGSLNFPKAASVNEPQMIRRLAERMKERQIIPELEVFDSGMLHGAKVLIQQRVLVPPFYVNILLGSLYSAPGTLFELSHLVMSLPNGMHWAAAGIGKFQQKINYAAVLMGGHVRVGLEDNLYYDTHKRELATNTMLIERVVRFAEELGRAVATPAEARQMLGFAPVSVEGS